MNFLFPLVIGLLSAFSILLWNHIYGNTNIFKLAPPWHPWKDAERYFLTPEPGDIILFQFKNGYHTMEFVNSGEDCWYLNGANIHNPTGGTLIRFKGNSKEHTPIRFAIIEKKTGWFK